MEKQQHDNALDLDALLKELQQEEPQPTTLIHSGFVAVVGQPNAGKSTLINHLVGQKIAIVSPKPQTTRRRILGILTTDEAQIIFVDTPGIHTAHHKLGEYMNVHALGAIPDADVVLFLVQAPYPPNEMDYEIARQVSRFTGPKILLINKVDLVEQQWATQRYEEYQQLGEWDQVLLISALEGHGVEAVQEKIIEHLPLGPYYYPAGQVTDQTERVLAAEIVREVALHHLMQEVPHSLNVEVRDWKKRRNGMIYIEAIIYVERKGQKRIVIGTKGQMLKEISTKARVEIERELGKRIYLELWVKVRDKWRNSENWLRRWGYKPE